MYVVDGYNLMDLERAGQLGSPLLATDMDLLQVKPLRPFAAGEICAFKEALTPAQAAAAAAHRRAGTTDGEDTCSGNYSSGIYCTPESDYKTSVLQSDEPPRAMVEAVTAPCTYACQTRPLSMDSTRGALGMPQQTCRAARCESHKVCAWCQRVHE